MLNRKRLRGVLAATIVVLGIGAGAAGAATIHVRNNGLDSATCGAVPAPCRTISQGIANAASKDRILVGPGLYGDLNGNGILGEPGEEPSSIFVDKPLTLESEEGAGATVIDMGGLHIDVIRVLPPAVGAVIGLPGRGFTLSGGGWGLSTQGGPSAGQLSISGNIATNNLEDGFLLHEPGPYFLTNNLALRNGTTGFLVHGGTGHKFLQNVAVGNGFAGFTADFGTDLEFSYNLSIGNTGNGFLFDIRGLLLRGNSALGNRSAGVALNNTTGTVFQNNIYGNDPAANCGIASNNSGGVNAANNYFGASTGPGANPADNVCIFSGSLTYTPFAPIEFSVATTWK